MICLYADMFNKNDEFIFDRPSEDMFSFVYNGEIVAKDKDCDKLKQFRNMHILSEAIRAISLFKLPIVSTDITAFVCGITNEQNIDEMYKTKLLELDLCDIVIEIDSIKSKDESKYYRKVKELVQSKLEIRKNVKLFSYQSILKNDIIRRDFLELCEDIHGKKANNIL